MVAGQHDTSPVYLAWAKFLLLFISCLLFTLPANTQTRWFKYDGNPVLDVGPPGSWDETSVFAPRVLPVGDTLKMWFTGRSGATHDRIGYAWSTDGGYIWTKFKSNPVMVSTQPWENGWTFSPYVVFDGSSYKMWYTGADGEGRIGYAVSPNGFEWKKWGRNPVLDHGPEEWDLRRVEWPCILGPDKAGGFKMWYAGYDFGAKYSIRIGYAMGMNETTWTKADDINPVLAPESGVWDARRIKYPRVILCDVGYEMWYSGGTHQYLHHQFGYATSSDGIHWKRHEANPVLRPGPELWDAQGMDTPEILLDGDMYRMWYGGDDGTFNRIGYAVSPKGLEVTVSSGDVPVRPGIDPVRVAVNIPNPAGFSFSASINIATADTGRTGDGELIMFQEAFIDLYDDGAHGDQLAGDGHFADIWIPQEEALYIVNLHMRMKERVRSEFVMERAAVLSTIGPMRYEHLITLGNATPHPGDTVLVKLVLGNHGTGASVRSVSASLTADPSQVREIAEFSPHYGDIASGESGVTEGSYRLLIDPECPANTDVTINVAISSLGIKAWQDSFSLRVFPPWWNTEWAYGLYALVGLVGLYGVRRLDLRRTRRKHEIEIERLQAERLKELDQLKSRFFANISHEFRTPLTLIEGPAKQLASGEFADDVREPAAMIVRNSQRLLRLVNQLLDLSRIEAGQVALRMEETNICDLLKSCAAAFESLAKDKGITFSVRCDEDPVIGWFDRDAVEKIVTNLLSNAFKFTQRGGHVSVTASRNDSPEYVTISVADNGIGIDSDQLDRVFDRFYQVDMSHTREQGGTGIGLALTKELTELHQGEIGVTSEPGRGSTFTVRLPLGKERVKSENSSESEGLATKDVTQIASPVQDDDGSATGGTGNECLPVLLIVEDNADMHKYIRRHLADGYRMIEAMNGEEGIRKATESIPDLIISDVMMPKMDGFQLCRKLKTDERTSHIPVILLTAKAESEQKIEGLETGADDYVMKPFEARELQVRVKNLIEQRKKLRERFGKEGGVRLKEIAITSADERFMSRAIGVVETHISDRDFTAEEFAREMFLSRMQLHRKIRALTDLSPWQFVRKVRLHRAADMLQKCAGNVAEIAYQIGYESPSKFSEAFRREFGYPPSEYRP